MHRSLYIVKVQHTDNEFLTTLSFFINIFIKLTKVVGILKVIHFKVHAYGNDERKKYAKIQLSRKPLQLLEISMIMGSLNSTTAKSFNLAIT